MEKLIDRMCIDADGRFHNTGKILYEEIFGASKQFTVDFGDEGIHIIKSGEVIIQDSLFNKLYDHDYDINEYLLNIRASRLLKDDLKTGSLSRIKVDMLPHQLIMENKVLQTKARGFLIADDVGLGKTIETGLIIKSMIAHGRADRILLLCPASLTYQWQGQMLSKFNEWFDILNAENKITDPMKFDYSPRLIASIHTLKLPENREILLDSSKNWDLVIVDEAHHLSAREYTYDDSSKISNTRAYQLLKKLRDRTGFFLFLTATPHQGDNDRFALLLGLLDPNYVKSSRDLPNISDRLNDIMGRNVKSEVTDFDGNKIFKGHDVFNHEVEPLEEYKIFLDDLKQFVNKGLVSLNQETGNKIRAENFVLTSFLKLAASSPLAIKRTLQNRLNNLSNGTKKKNIGIVNAEVDEYDNNPGEKEESAIVNVKEIFDGEINRITILLDKLVSIQDIKLTILDQILDAEDLIKDPTKRLLIFTEYRGTQDMIKEHLEGIFGVGSVLIMNGDSKPEEKRSLVKKFEKEQRFLVSTEAGGEGLDLQMNCHIMINYDIPWNPMRLQQRIGRLDRYGQTERVHVHYIIVKDTIDESIESYLEDKLERIQAIFDNLDKDAAIDLSMDILGQAKLNRTDFTQRYLYNDSTASKNLDKSVELAKEIFKSQEEIFKNIKSSNINIKIKSQYSLIDLQNLIEDYLNLNRIRMIKGSDGSVKFNIPEIIDNMKTFHGKRLNLSEIKGTFDKVIAKERNIELLGIGNEYIDAMIDKMIKNSEHSKTLAIKVQIQEDSKIKDKFNGKKGILVSYIINSVSCTGGKQSFDGVEFYFVNQNDLKTFYEDDGVKSIIEELDVTCKLVELQDSDLPEINTIIQLVKSAEDAARAKIRDGRIGSITLNTLCWIEFV